jgi:hypothetical protein
MKPRSLVLSSLIVAIPTACAAIGGIAVPGIYEGLFPKDFLPGAFAQDVLTLIACLLLVAVSLRKRGTGVKARVAALGLYGSIWYLYGRFTIERVYNQFYLLYVAAFAASFWAMRAGPMVVSFAFSALMLAVGLNRLRGLVIGSATAGDPSRVR